MQKALKMMEKKSGCYMEKFHLFEDSRIGNAEIWHYFNAHFGSAVLSHTVYSVNCEQETYRSSSFFQDLEILDPTMVEIAENKFNLHKPTLRLFPGRFSMNQASVFASADVRFLISRRLFSLNDQEQMSAFLYCNGRYSAGAVFWGVPVWDFQEPGLIERKFGKRKMLDFDTMFAIQEKENGEYSIIYTNRQTLEKIWAKDSTGDRLADLRKYLLYRDFYPDMYKAALNELEEMTPKEIQRAEEFEQEFVPEQRTIIKNGICFFFV